MNSSNLKGATLHIGLLPSYAVSNGIFMNFDSNAKLQFYWRYSVELTTAQYAI